MDITRRELIKAGGAAAFIGARASSGEPQKQAAKHFRFGVIADPQYAPVPNTYGVKTRFYSNSLSKLAEAIATFNGEELDFVITLGDLIDRYSESYQHILSVYDNLKHEKFFLLGNHDFNVPDEFLRSIHRTVGMPAPYYDFTKNNYRFIVLDGNEISLFAPPKGDPRKKLAEETMSRLKASGAKNALVYNGALSDTQFAWLQERVRDAVAQNQKIILFNHYPVFPAHELNLWDSDRVLKLVTDTPNIVAYMNGHNHEGNYGETGGKHFVTFKGMVETPTATPYAIVDVHPDRLEVKGFGSEQSRVLKIG